MIYCDFQGLKLSQLGFGTMRLPTLGAENVIDEALLADMVRYAIDNGVNYFDTAYAYHGGVSETAIGKALKAYPRESFYLATKFPGHQISKSYDPAVVFEDQLQKCGVDYFDFYLLHNVYENSIGVYNDPQWGIIEYFKEQKRLGRIKHLGFSTHGRVEMMRSFLEQHGKDMEFCQIQLNYLDWTLQEAKEKCDLLREYGLPIWVMEPVRGGRLAKLSEADEQRLKAQRPDESIAAWAFRYLQGIEGVTMVLSGMSNLEQMVDNVKTFAEPKPLSADELALLYEIAEGMKDSLPCTACRYCCDGCPVGLDIPKLISVYNDLRFASGNVVVMLVESLPKDKRPDACIGCGACARVCPQNIDIPAAMKDFAARVDKLPKWSDICRKREEEAEKARLEAQQ